MKQYEKIEDLHEDIFVFLRDLAFKDSDFRFTIRKSDKENRLSKGYYFYGNDDYLAVSFWSGTNWKNKTPNIIFVILPYEDTVYLEISVSDSDEKEGFVKQFLLDSELDLVSKNGKYYIALNGDTDSYTDILQKFIDNEKQIIDRLVADNQSYFKNLDSENKIGMIDKDLFQHRLEKALEYRQKKIFKTIDEFPSYLKELKIRNFNGIVNLEIEDLPTDTQWIFFTGINGSGKSSILKALTLGLCPNVKEHLDFEEPGHYVVSAKLHRGDKIVNSLVEPNKFLSSQILISKGFAAYGPSRLLVGDSNKKNNISPRELKRKQTNSYSIFHPDGILLDFSSEITSLSEHSDDIKAKEKLAIIIETIIECIDPLSTIYPPSESNPETLFVEKDEDGEKYTPIKFFQLSSGTKSLIAMIGDMMIRLFKQQSETYDIGELKGIVLIDEIDLHFHPKQQQNLIKALTDSFPKIQFIVTTHSPIPLLGAPKNSVILTVNRTKEKGVQATRLKKLETELQYLLPNTILTSSIFDFDYLESFTEERFTNLTLEDNYSNIQKRQELNEKLSSLDKNIFPDQLFNED